MVRIPYWVQQGVFRDLTEQIDGLSNKAELQQGHIDAGTYEGKEHTLPFVTDISVMVWNKDLYREAGLDPEVGPTTLEEYEAHATAIAKLGKSDVSGTFIAGSSGGALVFTLFPMLWASGKEVLSDDGTQSFMASEDAKKIYSSLNRLAALDGGIGAGSKEETGATWTAAFSEGRVGVMPYAYTAVTSLFEESPFEVGVAAIPGVDGGGPTFLGGDAIGISRNCAKPAQAWNFMAWLMSDEAQRPSLLTTTTPPPRSASCLTAMPRLTSAPARPTRPSPTGARRSPSTSTRPSTLLEARGSCSFRTECGATALRSTPTTSRLTPSSPSSPARHVRDLPGDGDLRAVARCGATPVLALPDGETMSHTLTAAQERRIRRVRRRENLRAGAYVAPTVVMLVLFFIVPIVLVVIMSISRWTLLGGNMGTAFPDNFVKVLRDPMLVQSTVFTLKYTVVTTIILMPIALGLALLIQEARRWNAVVRTAILLPAALGIASASLLFYAIYSPQVGPVTDILAALGLAEAGSSVLGTPTGALIATVVLVVWRFAGYYMILTMVGVQAIPTEVYEAAKIDGAGRWRTFTDVTFPLLKPTIAMTTIMSVTGSLLAFDQFFILTKGGPNNSTMTVVQLIYKYAFETKRDLGMAAALSVLVLIALVVVNAIQLRAMGVTDSEEK